MDQKVDRITEPPQIEGRHLSIIQTLQNALEFKQNLIAHAELITQVQSQWHGH